MKKLLSLLSISTLLTSVPAPLLANVNAPLTRAKRDVSALTFNSNNDHLPPTKINMSYFGDVDDVSSIMIDKQNNVYFGADKGAFVLKQGSTRLTKINGINSRVYSVAIDSNNNNVYFRTRDNGAYVLKQGETTAERINGISEHVYSVAIDKQNNVYFGTSSGVYILNQGKIIATKMNKINDDIKSIFIDKQDNVYFDTAHGFYVLKQKETMPTKINGINEHVSSIAIDNNNNVYFGTYEGVFVLKQGETTAERINGISEHVSSIAIDNNNNVYFGSDYGAFVLKRGSTTVTKINNIFPWINSVSVDSKDNVYFGTYEGVFVLKQGSTTVTPIKGGSSKYVSSIAIDNNNNVYFGGDNRLNYITTILDWVKQRSQFNLVDSTKTMIWTRPDLITVDGELNIEIANPNIDKVLFDNVQQPQTAKKWTINVKPEISEKDHNLQVFFTLDGKQYTSEIMVSMQAKIVPPTPSIKENLDEVIKFGDDNNLGNILDNNDNTIEAKIQQINSRIIDFSQITIAKKDIHSATLTAKKDSKSYQGSVVVKYNVVPATIVDLKIDLQPTAPTAQVDKDYVGQIDPSTITNPVNTFYYANSESKIIMLKPTASSVITGVLYGCDEQWNKTSQQRTRTIDSADGIVLDGSQLATSNGKYVVELSDNLGHTNNIYLQISSKQAITNYFDTPNGKKFEQRAEDNGYKNIRGSSASQLNNLFALSKTWKQSLAHLKLQLDNFVVDDIKNVTQDEINTYKTKLLDDVKSQVEKYVPDIIENTDYKVLADNLVAGDWTTSKDVKIQAVDGSTKLLSFTAKTIPVQPKDHLEPPIPNTGQTPAPDNKDENNSSKLWIIGVVVGVLASVGLAYLLFRKFIFNKYILPKIYARRQQKVVEQWKRDDREEAEELARKQAEREEKQNKQNDNNKGGNE